MHELAIAVSLVELASEKARSLGDVRVEVLHLRIGALSGVVSEALEFSFDLAAEGTPIAGARLSIEEVPVVVLCRRCASEGVVRDPSSLRCPDCGLATPDVVSGKELELRAMEVTEHAAPNG